MAELIDLTRFETPSTFGPVGDEPFKVVSEFAAAGDQSRAIEQLSDGVQREPVGVRPEAGDRAGATAIAATVESPQ